MMVTETEIKPRPPLLRLFVDYNPFYVMSAMCMLFGVFAVNDSLNWSPIPLKNLLTMIVTLNVYEAALIALGILLLRVDVRRDALLLMTIEAFFLADVGFLNMEVFTINYQLGMTVNALLFAAAVVKLGVIFKAAGLRLSDGKFTFVLMELMVLFAAPGIFAIIAQPRNDVLPPLAVFAAWWLAGFLPVMYVMTAGSFDIFGKPMLGWLGTDRIMARVLIVLPLLSLLAHLCLANWIYKVTFHPANIAPLLLGIAFAVGRIDQHLASLLWRMRMQMALPFLAIGLAAIKFPKAMVFDIHGTSLSPLRLVLLASMLIYLDGMFLYRTMQFAMAALMCCAMASMGHNVATINDNSIATGRWWAINMKKLIPTTMKEWGMMSVASSFALLLMGAYVSLMRRKNADG